MTSFNLTGSSTIARSLTGGESGLIGAQATLSVSGATAVAMSGGFNRLLVTGAIQSDIGSAVVVSGGANLVIGQGANLISGAFFSMLLQPVVSGGWNLSNAGTIIGASSGIGWTSFSSSAEVSLNAVNTGTIAGANNNGAAFSTSLDSELHNSGKIIGGIRGVSFSSQPDTDIIVKNSGEVTGAMISYRGGFGNDLVDNAGLMNGDVNLQSGNDKFLNTGSVLGAFDGGQGNDLFDGRFGTITGAVQGSEGSDTLIGGAGDEALVGGADNDTLIGNGGADTLVGEVGEDRLEGGDGNDHLLGGSQSDRLKGGAGNDIINGGTNFDTVNYSGVFTSVLIDLENDAATGGGGSDQLIDIENACGSASHDTIYGTQAHGNRLEGSFGNDTIYGLDGDDTMLGGHGDDRLLGGSGEDTMLGGAGDDYIDGGRGRDFYNGGDGADNFVFRSIADMGMSAAGRDQVRDFDASEGDVINLFLIDANTTVAGNQAFVVTNGYSGAGGELVLFDFVISGVDVTVASMDVDGDSVTDVQIYIVDGAEASDFVL